MKKILLTVLCLVAAMLVSCDKQSHEEIIVSLVEEKIDSIITSESKRRPEIRMTKSLAYKSDLLIIMGDTSKNDKLVATHKDYADAITKFLLIDALVPYYANREDGWNTVLFVAKKMDEANKKYNNAPSKYRMFFIYNVTLNGGDDEIPMIRTIPQHFYFDYDVKNKNISGGVFFKAAK